MIGFVGVGNMGSALIKGSIKKGALMGSDVLAFDKDQDKLTGLERELGIRGARGLGDLTECNILFLCVKPQDILGLLFEIKPPLKPDTIMVSIAAGISIWAIESVLGKGTPIIRAMPNTPALIGEGVTAICANEFVPKNGLEKVKSIFQGVGHVVEVEERDMDLITALSGSGPGFVFRIMESFIEAAKGLGLEEGLAKELVLRTFLGAARLATEDLRGLKDLREMVTSKGGTTQAGLTIYEELDLDSAISKMLLAASIRAKELGEALLSKLSE